MYITEALITCMCIEISPLMLQDLIRKCWWTYLNCTAIKNHWDIASSRYLSHIYNISCFICSKERSLFAKETLLFLRCTS